MDAAAEAVNYFLQRNNCVSPTIAPMRSLSSPSALTAAQPIRGGSVFSRRPISSCSNAPPTATMTAMTIMNGTNGSNHERAIVEEEEGEDEDEISLSQATAAAVDDTPFSIELTPYTAARSESVMDRLLAASNLGMAASSSSSGSPNTTDASSSPVSILPALPSTPTRDSSPHVVESPPTVKLDRHAVIADGAGAECDGDASMDQRPDGPPHHANMVTPRSLTFASTSAPPPSTTPGSSNRLKRPFERVTMTAATTLMSVTTPAESTPAPATRNNCSPCPTVTAHTTSAAAVCFTPLSRPPSSSTSTPYTGSTPTPQKTRRPHGIFSKPATPVGKMAAQAAALARGNTPATNRTVRHIDMSQTPTSVSTSTNNSSTTPQLKKAKLGHPTSSVTPIREEHKSSEEK